MATRHLVDAGHRGVAFLEGGSPRRRHTKRHAGYLRALRQAGVEVVARHVLTDLPTIDDAEDAASACSPRQTPRRPCSPRRTSSPSAPSGHCAGSAAIEVAVVGFDDFVLADLLDPAVTVVAQDPHGTGRRAAKLLFRRVDGETGPYVREVLPTRLIARGSARSRLGVAAADPAGAEQFR